MAIGSSYGTSNGENTGKKQLYENTYYSRLRIKNDNVKLSLGYSFRSGNLILEISEIKEGFQYNAIESIFISPTKALLLVKEIDNFKEYVANEKNIDTNKAFGITSGFGEKVSYIGFHASKTGATLVTIGKIDGSGNITNSVTIPFNTEYNYSVEWDNIEKMELVKAYHEGVELEQLQNLLIDFSRSMNGAFAYSFADLTRYDHKAILNKLDPIYDSLGIERRSSSKSYGENNFLLNAGKTTSNHTNYDDIESSFE